MSQPPSDNRRTLFQGRFLKLVEANSWEFVVRREDVKAVGIVAVTPASELVLISQYREPVAKRVIEIPAGLVGDGPGKAAFETWETAARRELTEETGWVAAAVERLVEGPSSAGLTSECVMFVRATGLTRGRGQALEGDEKIDVHEVPLATVDSWLRQQEAAGAMIDPKVWVALYFVRCR